MNAMLDLFRTLIEYADKYQVPVCIEIGNVLFKYEPVAKKNESILGLFDTNVSVHLDSK
jgi:hypothetical protein